MKNIVPTKFCLILFFALCLGSLPGASHAEDVLIKTAAKQAIVVDYDTGQVLLEKNANQKMPTSSMSKVITMYLVFDALKSGKITLDDTFSVSEAAWRKGGSKMFVEVDKQVRIEDLIRGVLIQSGNDATIVLAEGLAGSEDAFATMLNAAAKNLGMKDSHFTNASGWPDPDHFSTAHDLAILAAATIRDFPEYYPYYAEQEFTYNNIKQRNRNPLLYRNIGADGIKTGHTEDGGYGLIGSGTLNGRRVIMVLNGMEDERMRAQESAKILEWGLKRFENHEIFKAGAPVETASVVLGKAEDVVAVLKENLVITVPQIASSKVTAEAVFKEPLIAPVAAGDEIGKLVVHIPGFAPIERKLYAEKAVEEMGFFARSLAKISLLLSGADKADESKDPA